MAQPPQSPAPATARPASPQAWLAPLLVAATAIAAYHGSLHAPLFLDDFRSLIENPSIRRLGDFGAVLTPEPRTMLASRPLTNLSFALNHAVGGLNVTGYHAFNLALHYLASLTLLGLVRRTVGAPVALPVAAAWAAHPLLVPAVSYISQRSEVLMGLCYLLTLYGFVRGAEGRRGWLAVSAGACAAGMAAKEVMVTAPLAVLLCDRIFFAGALRDALRARRAYYVALAASWLLLALLMRRGLDPTVGMERGVGAGGYALVQCKALALYATRALWPHPLAFDYGEFTPLGVLEAARFAWAPLLVIGGLAFACLRRSAPGFWLGWIALTLAPTSSFVPITLQPIAENRTYLALAGALAAGGYAIHRFLGRRSTPILAAIVAAFVALTIQRNQVFARAPWAEALRANPDNARALNNLAVTLHLAGRAAEAEPLYRRAAELKPASADFQNSLASVLLTLGRADASLPHAREAVRLAPGFAAAHANLGAALLSTGQAADGLAALATALRHDPALPHAHHNLALAFTEHGRPGDALPHYEVALAHQPDNAFLHRRHAQALHAVGRREAALAALSASLQRDPAQPDLHLLAGVIHFETGRLAESLDATQKALALKPDYPEARYNSALILERLGRSAEALREIETALRLRPDNTEARAARERLRAAVR